MPLGFTMGRKKQKAEKESQLTEKEFLMMHAQIASLTERLNALSNDRTPRAGAGGVNLVGGVILPSRPTWQQVEPDTEQSETVPRNTSNSMVKCIPATGVTQRGVEPPGSTPPRYVNHLERALGPTWLTSIQVDPNTVNAEICPHVKSGSTMAVLDSNATSTHNAIIPLINPREDLMSEVVSNPQSHLHSRNDSVKEISQEEGESANIINTCCSPMNQYGCCFANTIEPHAHDSTV
jgi:hypothetical protein